MIISRYRPVIFYNDLNYNNNNDANYILSVTMIMYDVTSLSGVVEWQILEKLKTPGTSVSFVQHSSITILY